MHDVINVPRWILIALLIGLGFFAFNLGKVGDKRGAVIDIPYSTFKTLVTVGGVEEVEIRGDAIIGRFETPQILIEGRPASEYFRTNVPAFGDEALLSALESSGIVITVQSEEEGNIWDALIGLIPWLLIIFFYLWLVWRMRQGMAGGLGKGGDLGSFLRGDPSKKLKKVTDVTFDDVAGQENAKREVAELVDYLNQPERYLKLGADVPHGVLLMGPPGTGKTLLARALAGEAGVPFFSISASEFIEVFVGVGASRVRGLFEEAKKNAPSIIFIDELDSIGRVRGAGLGGGHDEREQTLNQILAELDGFGGHEAVVVLAATNRPDVLDTALLRPGRFDRHITLDLPDRKARLEILKVHTRKVPLADDVDLDVIAGGTPGFSGADLKNLVNEAAMMGARESVDAVCARHFDEMRERVVMGAVRTLAIEPGERHRLAVHESGHTVAAYFLDHADPLFKVSIIPRGQTLGGTQLLPEKERHTMSEEYLRDRLSVLLGGRAAEKIALGSVSSGADEDIKQATKLARAMVSRWGMSEEVGPMDARESEEHPFLGREIAQPRQISETTARMVDGALRHLLFEVEERAIDTIKRHRKGFDALVVELEKNETLDRDAIEACLGPMRLESAENRTNTS